MSKSQTVTQRVTGSLKWSVMAELVTRIAQPLIFVILARLLTPEDFGVVGVAVIAISFTTMFWDAGLGKALVQTKMPLEKAANVVFWMNLVLGLTMYAGILASAGWIADFFKSPDSKTILRVLGLRVVILSVASVQQFLLMRDLSFRKIFWARLAMALTPAFFSIPMAFLGYGVWALVVGSLVGAFMNTLILWMRSPWRPTLNFDWQIARSLLAFGAWVTAEGLGIWFIAWGDQLLVGRFMNVNDLGVYRVACSASMLIFAFSVGPFIPVLYPMFSKFQGDMDRLMEVFRKANRVIISLALPISAGLLLTGKAIALVIFGEKWVGLGYALSVVGFSIGISWIVFTNGEVYRAIGRPDVNTKFMYFQLLIYIPAYIIGAQHGLKVFVCVKLTVCLITIFFHVWLCVRMLKVSYFYLWHQGKPMILATAVMSVAVCLTKEMLAAPHFKLPPAVNVSLVIVVAIIVYGAALWLLDRSFVLDTKRIALRAVSRG